MFKRIKVLFRAIREVEAWHGLLSWTPFTLAISTLAPLITVALGVIGKLPLMWVAVGSFVSAAAAAVAVHFLLRIPQLTYIWGTEHKLNLEGVDFRPTFDANRIPVAFKRFNIGIGLANTATYPISFIVDDWQLVLNGKTITDRKPKARYTIEPMSAASYRDLDLDFSERFGGEFKGSLRFALRYGREGAERYRIEKDIRFTLEAAQGSPLGIVVSDLTFVQRGEDGIDRELGFRASPLLAGWPIQPRPVATQKPEIA